MPNNCAPRAGRGSDKNEGVLADDISEEGSKGLGELIRQCRAPNASAAEGQGRVLERLKGIS